MAESVKTTDASGSVAAANVFQQVLPERAARRLLIIEGISATILVDFGAQPTDTTHAIQLAAGEAMVLDVVCPREAVWVSSATNGATFVVKEGT